MWAFMKAEGPAKDADAQHVYVECMRQPEMALVELTTSEVDANCQPRLEHIIYVLRYTEL